MAEIKPFDHRCGGTVRASGPTDEFGETPMNCDKCGHPFVVKKGRPYTAIGHARRHWEQVKAGADPASLFEYNEKKMNEGQFSVDVST